MSERILARACVEPCPVITYETVWYDADGNERINHACPYCGKVGNRP